MKISPFGIHGNCYNTRMSLHIDMPRLFLPIALTVAGLVWLSCITNNRSSSQWHAFFGDGEEWFCDYRMPRECAAAKNAYRPETIDAKDACYPPFGYAILSPLPRDVRKGGLPFTSGATLVFLLSAFAFVWRVTDRNVPEAVSWLAAVSLSAPLVTAFGVGNQVLLSAAGTLLFLTWQDDPSPFRRRSAVAALAVAAALKVTPAVFALLLLKRRDFRGFLFCGLLGGSLTLLPFVCYGGIGGIVDFLSNLRLHSAYYGPRTTWGFVAIDRAMRIALQGDFLSLAQTYPLSRLASILLGLACLFRFFRTHDGTLALTMLAGAISLLPAPAQPYTALYLVPAMISSARGTASFPELFSWFAVFCVLQLPVGHGSLNHALAGAVFTALVAAKALLPSRQEDDDVVDDR